MRVESLFFAGLAGLVASPVWAQDPAAPPPPEEPVAVPEAGVAPAAADAPADAAIADAAPAAEPPPVTPPPVSAVVPLPPTGTFTAAFSPTLGQQHDVMLQGIHATEQIPFTTTRTWQLTADPVILVKFEHSAALLPERSHLNVSVNGLFLSTVRLDALNAVGGVLRVTVPRSALNDEFNAIALDVEQHYTNDCEDPFDPALWTRVSKASEVSIPYARHDVTPDLLQWPAPFFDKWGYGPMQLTLVGGSAMSAPSVQAAGALGVAMGRLAAWRGVEFQPPVSTAGEVRTNGIIIGTPAEVPEIGSLLGELALREDQGLVAVVPSPSDPTLAILIVTGGGAEGVARAAAALAGQDRYQILSGARATVNSVVTASPPPTRQDPLPAPHEDSFTVADLGLEGQTLRGYYPAMYRIPLHLEADALPRPGGGSVRIDYTYSAQLDTRLSAMEIRLGGLSLRSVPLAKVEGADKGSVMVSIPEDLVNPNTPVDVIFHLFPRDFNACEHITDRQIWATVLPSSTIDLPRDHLARMPDLSRLQYDTWPFTMESGNGVVAVLPDNPSPGAISAGLDLAAELGRTSVAENPDFALQLATNSAFSTKKDSHWILLVDDTSHALYDSLASEDRLSTEGGPARELKEGAQKQLLGADVGTSYGTIEEVLSPSNDKRAVLVLRAPSAAWLPQLVDFATDSGKTRLLKGNLAVVSPQGDVRTVDVGKRKDWGQLSAATAAQIGVRQNWWVIGLGLLGAAVVVAGGVRMWVRGQGETR